MDLNIIVLSGQLAAEPEVRVFESGARLVRLLVTVRSTEPRRRVDVIPVVLWDPDEAAIDSLMDSRGRGIWIAGAVQRRFWSSAEGKASRIEVVAHAIEVRDESAEESHDRMTG
jgi:single-stranded DNA-binding protein